jgi:hypothetical protein
MGSFRFFRRKQLMPGLRVNVSKSGPSLSFGVRGAHVTVGRRGVTRTVGVPGSGVFYTSRRGRHTGVHTARADDAASLRRHLEELHSAGLLTDEELAAKRAQIDAIDD